MGAQWSTLSSVIIVPRAAPLFSCAQTASTSALSALERKVAQLESELGHRSTRVQQLEQELDSAKSKEQQAQEHAAGLQKHVADVEFALADSYQELTRGNALIAQLQEQVTHLTATINDMSNGAIQVGWEEGMARGKGKERGDDAGRQLPALAVASRRRQLECSQWPSPLFLPLTAASPLSNVSAREGAQRHPRGRATG